MKASRALLYATNVLNSASPFMPGSGSNVAQMKLLIALRFDAVITCAMALSVYF